MAEDASVFVTVEAERGRLGIAEFARLGERLEEAVDEREEDALNVLVGRRAGLRLGVDDAAIRDALDGADHVLHQAGDLILGSEGEAGQAATGRPARAP